MGKFVVIILDGFGIGAMGDVSVVRPADYGANTCLHIFQKVRELELPNLAKLGLANALGAELEGLPRASSALCGTADLAHYWADTYFGHQEIMGTKPTLPNSESFNDGIIDKVELGLSTSGYLVRREVGDDGKGILVVNEAVTVADNIECDPGQAINVTAALDYISFETAVRIGEIVRKHARTPRVIVFGGCKIILSDLLNAVEVHGSYIGVNAPRCGVYKNGYQCVHLGFGVDDRVQVPIRLAENGIKTRLVGKVADVCQCEYGSRESVVDTDEVFHRVLELMESDEDCFICANVQETDLAGHAQDVERYAERLGVADKGLGHLVSALGNEDILIVMADHGNDPTIGHSHHTRERVPILVYSRGARPGQIGNRKTLSDVGATVAEYFGARPPENGLSFMNCIKK